MIRLTANEDLIPWPMNLMDLTPSWLLNNPLFKMVRNLFPGFYRILPSSCNFFPLSLLRAYRFRLRCGMQTLEDLPSNFST